MKKTPGKAQHHAENEYRIRNSCLSITVRYTERSLDLFLKWVLSLILVWMATGRTARPSDEINLNAAVIVTRPGDLPSAEQAAATVLCEETEKRTGIRMPITTDWPDSKVVIAISSDSYLAKQKRPVPVREGNDLPELRPEGYRLFVDTRLASQTIVWILGADPRATLYGVGALLRNLKWTKTNISLPHDLDIATAPAYPMRGHQLGYRALANSWDAWTPEQFDQYIRELVLFGVNSIENIPFQDKDHNPLIKFSRREMNKRMSDICDRYDLDYWVFAPADFDLQDNDLRDDMLKRYEQLFRDCKRLDAVFFPGGDPGDNPPELALPFLEDIAERLLPHHPNARIWMSLLGFDQAQVDVVFSFIKTQSPAWFGGMVMDTSGPPLPDLRKRLPRHLGLRLYPDITHNKLCQFPVPWWDPAYSLTLGREAINPRPAEFADIINWFAPSSDGFITYSDGVHDDVNKVVWSMRGWDPAIAVRDILVQYARLFFGSSVATKAADAILALEKNWQGPLATNGSVDGTLLMWQRLESRAPQLAGNWRWQMNLVRAYYDAYTRHRLLYETKLEDKANAILATAPTLGADKAMKEALAVLDRAETEPRRPDLLARIEQLCEDLFHSIGLQTSVERYHAANGERGAFLDYVNYPLNNRWWMEDEFAKIVSLDSEKEKLERLNSIRLWENPGMGNFYDDIGHIGKSPRVQRRGAANTDPERRTIPSPTFWWWGDGMDMRARLSWQWTMDWPEAVVYESLDPDAHYTVRMSGYGKLLLHMDGEPVKKPVKRIEIGDLIEYPVPPDAVKDRKLVLTWDVPMDEDHLNWRQQSRIAEVWLLKHDVE